MSIRIDHGYRIHTTDMPAFLSRLDAAIGPVRDRLDTLLYAEIVADLIDRSRDRPRPDVRVAALHEFNRRVTTGTPGQVWNHPHSFDLDYGHPPASTPEGPFYALAHCQRGDYHQALRRLPEVEPYPYWNNTDTLPENVTPTDWVTRRANWDWLITSNNAREAMTRWTHRPEPTLTPSALPAPEVVIEHLPTRTERALRLARDTLATDHYRHGSRPEIGSLFRVLASPQVQEVADQIEPTLPYITVANLTSQQPAPQRPALTRPVTPPPCR